MERQNKIEELWKEYSKKIYVYLGTLVGYNHEIRSDLVQTVFLKAYSRLDTLKPELPQGTWIITIARNTAIDFLKTQEREIIKTNSIAQITNFFQKSAEHEYHLRSDQDLLQQAVRELPAYLSEVLYLRYFEELSYGEIEKIIGVSSNTLRSRVSDAKIKLKNILEVKYGFSS